MYRNQNKEPTGGKPTLLKAQLSIVPRSHSVPGPYCLQGEYPWHYKIMTKTLKNSEKPRTWGIYDFSRFGLAMKVGGRPTPTPGIADLDLSSKVGKLTYPSPTGHREFGFFADLGSATKV